MVACHSAVTLLSVPRNSYNRLRDPAPEKCELPQYDFDALRHIAMTLFSPVGIATRSLKAADRRRSRYASPCARRHGRDV